MAASLGSSTDEPEPERFPTMVKVNGPAFSLSASGKLGGAIVFASWKGRPYARQLVVPSNPKSAMQTSMRAMMKFLAQVWTSLSVAEKADWEIRAAQTSISPFNAFVAYNQYRWRSFLMPSQDDPATLAGTPSTISGWGATAGIRQITLDWTVGTIADGWGFTIHRATAGTFTESLSNCIAVVACNSQAAFQYVDTPLVPATYYYSYISFTEHGLKGTPSAEVTAAAS